MKMPSYVKKTIKACVKDIVDSIKSSGVSDNNIRKYAKEELEDEIYSYTHNIYWGSKTADDSSVKSKIEDWVDKNATKEMYESYLGAKKSLSSILGNLYVNKSEKIKSELPELYSFLLGSNIDHDQSISMPSEKTESPIGNSASEPIEPLINEPIKELDGDKALINKNDTSTQNADRENKDALKKVDVSSKGDVFEEVF